MSNRRRLNEELNLTQRTQVVQKTLKNGFIFLTLGSFASLAALAFKNSVGTAHPTGD
jgi:hypothetical protein